MIQLSNIRYQYSNCEQTIVQDLSLKIEKGDVVLIEGNNGSGKTTLLRILAGIAPKFTGGVLSGQRMYLNQVYDEIDVSRFGMLFHGNDQQFIQSRVEQEILYTLETQDRDELTIDNKFQSIVNDFHLRHLLDREIQTLSSGEMQLLKLALAFVFRPDVILLDEPLSHLDLHWQSLTLDTLLQLKQKYDLTYVIAEHQIQPWTIFGNSLKKISLSENLPIEELNLKNIVREINGKTIVELKEIELSYADRTIFTGLNRTILEGQCVVISGSNGSGKTSLLNMLMGHVQPSKGKIVEVSELKKGFLTNPTIENFFSLTVADELKLNNTHNKPIFELKEFMSSFIFDLSQGEQRKVALSLLNDPSLNLLLLDEPFLHLDSQATQNLLTFIQLLKNSNISVVIAAHDPVFFQGLSDQVWNLGGL
jgi:energy-coupling factor transporter ATP-binding protein EcfA2